MIRLKTKEEIEQLKEGGKILADIVKSLQKEVKPGVSTGYLNSLAEKLIADYNCVPSFKNYRSSQSDKIYPFALCASLNEVIVHQLPSDSVILKEGDILTLDLGLWYQAKPKRLCVDAAVTLGIGQVSAVSNKLIETARMALDLAIKEAVPGKTLGDIGSVIDKYVSSQGFSVIKELVGHGVGYDVHEDPEILNFGRPNSGVVLKPGMVLAIEPMVSSGDWRIKKCKDGFGYQTFDNSLSSHFEATVAITDGGNTNLTPIN